MAESELDPTAALQAFRVAGPGERYVVFTAPPYDVRSMIPFGVAALAAIVLFMRGSFVTALVLLGLGIACVVIVGLYVARGYQAASVELMFSDRAVSVTANPSAPRPGTVEVVAFADIAEVIEPASTPEPRALAIRRHDGSIVELGSARLFPAERVAAVRARLRSPGRRAA